MVLEAPRSKHHGGEMWQRKVVQNMGARKQRVGSKSERED